MKRKEFIRGQCSAKEQDRLFLYFDNNKHHKTIKNIFSRLPMKRGGLGMTREGKVNEDDAAD
jgi:hypothetical protein